MGRDTSTSVGSRWGGRTQSSPHPWIRKGRNTVLTSSQSSHRRKWTENSVPHETFVRYRPAKVHRPTVPEVPSTVPTVLRGRWVCKRFEPRSHGTDHRKPPLKWDDSTDRVPLSQVDDESSTLTRPGPVPGTKRRPDTPKPGHPSLSKGFPGNVLNDILTPLPQDQEPKCLKIRFGLPWKENCFRGP